MNLPMPRICPRCRQPLTASYGGLEGVCYHCVLRQQQLKNTSVNPYYSIQERMILEQAEKNRKKK